MIYYFHMDNKQPTTKSYQAPSNKMVGSPEDKSTVVQKTTKKEPEVKTPMARVKAKKNTIVNGQYLRAGDTMEVTLAFAERVRSEKDNQLQVL